MNDYDSNDIRVEETKDRLTRPLFFIRQGADLPTMITDYRMTRENPTNPTSWCGSTTYLK